MSNINSLLLELNRAEEMLAHPDALSATGRKNLSNFLQNSGARNAGLNALSNPNIPADKLFQPIKFSAGTQQAVAKRNIMGPLNPAEPSDVPLSGSSPTRDPLRTYLQKNPGIQLQTPKLQPWQPNPAPTPAPATPLAPMSVAQATPIRPSINNFVSGSLNRIQSRMAKPQGLSSFGGYSPLSRAV